MFKHILENVSKNTRAAVRAVAGLAALPVILGLAAVQRTIAGPVFHNQTVIPKIFYNMMRGLLGYKIVFNAASAPIVKDKNKAVWFVANHQSATDAFVLGSVLDGSFVGKGEIMHLPLMSELARAVNFIAVWRKSQQNPQSRGKIAKNFNKGQNAIMFPEGTTDDEKEVGLFRAALPWLLYGGEKGEAVDRKGNPVVLKKEVVMQPVAVFVKEVDGQVASTGPTADQAKNDRVRRLFSSPGAGSGFLTRLWRRLQIKETVLEVKIFQPLDPKDKAFSNDAEKLLNKAALDVASFVNPGQTEFKKLHIPATAPTKKQP